jgi:hypothetical protein
MKRVWGLVRYGLRGTRSHATGFLWSLIRVIRGKNSLNTHPKFLKTWSPVRPLPNSAPLGFRKCYPFDMPTRATFGIVLVLVVLCPAGLAVAAPHESAERAVWQGANGADSLPSIVANAEDCTSQTSEHRALLRLRRAYVQASPATNVASRLLRLAALTGVPALGTANRLIPTRVSPVLAPISRRGPPSPSLA